MNNHAFAQGDVYNKPGTGITKLFQIILLSLKLYNRVRRLFKSAVVWAMASSKATFGTGCGLSEDTFIYNDGDKNNIVFGSNVVCRGILRAEYGGKIKVGDNVYIGDHCILSAYEEISIGNHTLISHGVHIFDNDSHPLDFSQRRIHFTSIVGSAVEKANLGIVSRKVIIEDDVWIGFNSIILKGVTLGRGAIIAAGSVVTRDVPSFSVAAGNPAMIKETRNTDVED